MTLTTDKVHAERFLSDDERWDAVVNRDTTADSSFFYSVLTTGVYCRPSCGARRPLRKNVAFHRNATDAEDAGFRPCKRCRPTEPPLAERQANMIASACRRIEAAEAELKLADLAGSAGMSRFHFQRVFKSVTGLTPKAYSTAHRAKTVRDRLRRRGTITDAVYDSGFNSSGRFYARSAISLGMTPAAFRAGGTGEQISFAVGECSLGSLLVAATGKGVCAILLGDDPEALVRDLQDRFRNAELIGGEAEFERLVSVVAGFIEAPGLGLDLPLDIRGTAFQQRVWNALSAIPVGSTATYSEIARRIGSPTAGRAVAGACAANQLAVAIPCHRVVRGDGSISGYRWGIARKQALLQREATQPQDRSDALDRTPTTG